MPRYKLTIEYDGGPFSGWQRQENGPSVQGALEAAAAALDGGPVDVFGAGRTDAGVHALGQVAHLDLRKNLRADTVRDALNAHLRPQPVAVLDAEEVAPDFHARFSAIGRAYLYRIIDRRPPLTLDAGKAWRIPQRLDADAMHAAAQHLIGRHDFTTFRDADCQAESPVKTLDALIVSRIGQEIQITTRARSFLHRQVRSMVGSLAEVGRGRWATGDIARILAAADRTQCGPVAPPDGLYLTKVEYPSA
jgi:tRNA pseudouridine38-40 synthase